MKLQSKPKTVGGLKKPATAQVKKPVSKAKATAKKTTSKKQDKSLSDVEKKIADVDLEIGLKKKQAESIQQEIQDLYKKRLELAIYPHKLGDKVLAEVQVGKTRKKSECVLEMGEGGTLYVRPFKNDGSPSGRRFSIIPVGETTYQDLLEKV